MPLFVVTGGNDPRVPPRARRRRSSPAVRKNGGTVWHMLAADEGHGYKKKANTDYNFWAVVAFWQKYLLGDAK